MGSVFWRLNKFTQREKAVVIALLLAAFFIRLPNLIRPYVINTDAIKYVQGAMDIANGHLWGGFERAHISLYPFLVVITGRLTGDWLLAARAISVVFGIFVVLPLYGLSREFLGRDRSWIPPALYAISPVMVRYSLDVIRGPLFWFLALCSFWLIFRFLRENGGVASLFGAGLTGLMATSVRPEGLVIPVFGSLVFSLPIRQCSVGLKGRVLRMLCLVSPFLIMGLLAFFLLNTRYNAPMPLDVKSYANQLERVFKGYKGLPKRLEERLSGLGKRQKRVVEAAWRNRWALAAMETVTHFIKTVHPLIFLLVLWGAIGVLRTGGANWRLLGLLVLLLLVVAYVRAVGAFFAVSKRHLILPAVTAYVFGACGVFYADDYLSKRFPRVSRGIIWLVLAAVIGLSTVPMCVRPLRADKLIRRNAGDWIKEAGWSRPVIATDMPRVAFYAGGRMIPLKKFLNRRDAEADLVAISVRDGERPFNLSILEELKGRGLRARMIKVFKGNGQRILIYVLER